MPISLVDVGCASGAFIYHAKRVLDIQSAVGVDISERLLDEARKCLPDVDFVLDSLPSLESLRGRQFDVTTCLGTIAILDDEIEELMRSLLSLARKGESLYILDLVNEYPVESLVRSRMVEEDGPSEWQPGSNVRSMRGYEYALARIDGTFEIEFVDFRIPMPIPQSTNPLRVWTIATEENENQVVLGNGQLFDFQTQMSEPPDLEHVTPFLYRHPDRFRIESFSSPHEDSSVRLVVDTEEDLARIAAMLALMDAPPWTYSSDDLVRLDRTVAA